MLSPSELTGEVRFASSKIVHGWALALDAPFTPLRVLSTFNGEPAPAVRADGRVRLYDQVNSLPNPECGFTIPVPADLARAEGELRVELVASIGDRVVPLPGSPCRVDTRHAVGRYGVVDGMRGTLLCGWARDADGPDRRPAIEVLLGDRVLTATRPSRFRSDLLDYGFEDGCYGFEVDLARCAGLLVEAELRVRFADGGELDGSPVHPFHGLGSPWSGNPFVSRTGRTRGGRPIVLGTNRVFG